MPGPTVIEHLNNLETMITQTRDGFNRTKMHASSQIDFIYQEGTINGLELASSYITQLKSILSLIPQSPVSSQVG